MLFSASMSVIIHSEFPAEIEQQWIAYRIN